MAKIVPSTGLLTIDLGAIVDNWRILRGRMHAANPEADCAAVVKADAYGLGVAKVAHALWRAGCRTFFVATLVEGIELRSCLNEQADIVVLGGLCHGIGEQWLQYKLQPALLDVSHVELWLSRYKELPCVVKVDTGMHRLGMSIAEYKNALPQLQKLKVSIVMSHLACADTPAHSLNAQQHRVFDEVASYARELMPEAKLSFANSSGLFLGDAFCFDLGRPGAALYGVNPTPYAGQPMNLVVQLQLPIMQIKTIDKGETAGYGGLHPVSRRTKLAIVFGGYADGLLRALSHSGFAYIGDNKVSIIGRVSMDSLIFDVTDVTDDSLAQGVVNILGAEQSVDTLASAANTIGYEVLTSLGKRYQRQYINSVVEEFNE